MIQRLIKFPIFRDERGHLVSNQISNILAFLLDEVSNMRLVVAVKQLRHVTTCCKHYLLLPTGVFLDEASDVIDLSFVCYMCVVGLVELDQLLPSKLFLPFHPNEIKKNNGISNIIIVHFLHVHYCTHFQLIVRMHHK